VNQERIHVLIPIYNDWGVVRLLLLELDRVLASNRLSADIVLVDDGSTVRPDTFDCPALLAATSVNILELRRNLGHQRAIAVGLTFLQRRMKPDVVVVMDGDGEDDPEDVPRLVAKLREEDYRKIVFAERTRRSESSVFKVGYRLYQLLHVVLTGYRVRVGNYSVVPAVALSRLVVISEMWNHYAAAVYNARIEFTTIPTSRGKRLGGQSHMNVISLVVHGLSALSVYGPIIGVRMLVAIAILVGAVGAGLVAMAIVALTGAHLPSWLPALVALLVVLLFQGVTAAVAFVFLMLSGRQGASVIPLRDYRHFVIRLVCVAPRP
jgi:glycosyltransferase involved in cell wall biosynthesis